MGIAVFSHATNCRGVLLVKLFLQVLLLIFLLINHGRSQAQQYAAVEQSSQPLSNWVCATCHGAYGQGNAVVGGPSLAGLEPWYIKAQLQKFRAGQRGTQGEYIPGFEMQASVARMSDAEIEDVIAYIATWKHIPAKPTLAGNATNGGELYITCAACHGSTAQGNASLSAPALAGRDDWYMYRQLKLFQSGYRGAHPQDLPGTQMRAAARALTSDQDIVDVLAFINTLRPSG